MISILPESNYAAVMAETVEPYLDSRRQEMDMPLSTGGTLHAEVYEQPDATRAVVILHGYTESAEKFREMTWYFLNEKFNVYAIDHRGHGKSVRKISDTSITHVDAFSDYLRDLEEFMSGVVLPRTEHLPRVLYAHSMGGAIGGMTLMNHPEYFAPLVQGLDIDLTLAGHAHGGQVRLGSQGIYSPGQGLFPKLTSGFYFDDKLFISRGMTNSACAPRLWCPCELVMVQLLPNRAI